MHEQLVVWRSDTDVVHSVDDATEIRKLRNMAEF